MVKQKDAPQQRLIQSLRRPESWPPGTGPVQVIETHISTVILAGDYAYKIKKPLDLGFLDFSTLALRHRYCHEEIRLNRRLAPEIYLDVVAISGTPEKPLIGGAGRAIEYAVYMRRFPQDGLLSDHIGLLDEQLIDRIAVRLVAFHQSVAVADEGSPYGDPGLLLQPMRENFAQIRSQVRNPETLARLQRLERWTLETHGQLTERLDRRKRDGAIRECHGDLHLGNMALLDGEPLIFDGIEFNPGLRWIDTMSELAFLLMDLDEKGRGELAWRLLNRYLELSGDYSGLPVLRFYQVYRAMVRAKVDAIRLAQAGVGSGEQTHMVEDFGAYLEAAEGYTRRRPPSLIITHGFSGAGKSRLTGQLMTELGAVRVRSDLERKRLAGIGAQEESGSRPGAGIYTREMSQRTYGRLLALAEGVVKAGFIAIVDAACLKSSQRRLFEQLAERLGIPFVILDFQLPERLLRERVRQRQREGGDPSEADLRVLARQQQTAEPLTESELRASLVVDTDGLSMVELRQRIRE